MREPHNMFVGLAAMLVTLLVGAGCASTKPLVAPADDRLGTVQDLGDSQFKHIDKALTGVDKALEQLR